MNDGPLEGFPLSPTQQHVWRLSEACAFPWNVGLRLAVDGPLEPRALEQALHAIARREEVLRTGLRRLAGASIAVQVIGDEPRVEVEMERMAASRALASERFDALLARPFALDAEPPAPCLRALLLTVDEGSHELHLVQPAALADVASLEVLAGLLAAELAGAPPPTPPPVDGDGDGDGDGEDEGPMQYADLAEWLQGMFESEEAPEGLGFWRRVDLAGVRAARLSLERTPTETGRRQAFRPARVPVEADGRVLAALEGEDGPARLLAAWQHLLARHTERPDAVVGLCGRGRAYEGLEAALGPFERTLPLALEAAEEDGLAAHAAAAGRAMDEAVEWHELWDLERARSGAEPAFLPFALEPFPALAPLSAGARTLRPLERRSFADRFRLKLVREPLAQAPLALWYDAAELDGEAARLLADQLATLLAGAVARPERPLAELPLASEAERERLVALHARGAPTTGLDDGLVHQAILAHAARTPDAPAVVSAAGTLTYGELSGRAHALAHRLAALEVGRGDVVGLALGRSPEWPVAMLATHLAGAAYLPLPPGYPAERIELMLRDSRAAVVLTRRAEAGAAPALEGLRSLAVDEPDASAGAPDPFPSSAEEGDTAYVIYTSGSTGTPKGVPIPHGNLARSTAARFAHYDRSPGRYLLLSSFAFDSSVAGVFWTLCAGGTLVLPAEGEETDLLALAGWIERERVTHTLALPSLWGALLDETPRERLASLELAIVAGEACTRELVERHRALLPGCRLHNEYGPTEATVWCTAHDCGLADERPLVPIGRPIPGAAVYVLDPRGALVPRGLAGELFVGGAGVAPGYLDRPELTAERFLTDPFAGVAGARLYRTGDLVRMRPSGALEFLGRVDQQVKVRGFRVELGEVESVLARAPGLQEAVVGARDDRSGAKELVAWVVRAGDAAGRAASADSLRAHLAGPLPEYMVPARFVWLDELPRLPNGKVDRGRLPDPSDEELHAPYAAPETPLEIVLAELWADVLDVERVGLDDDFFLLGGHSILATRLFARVTEALDVRIALRTLFEARTVRGLAREILADDAARPRVERAAELLARVLASDEGMVD